MERIMNILQINSSARRDASHSTRLAGRLVQRLREAEPESKLTALTRGGQYRNTPADTQVPYLRTVFTFLGLTDVQFVYAEGLAMGPDAERNAIASAHEQIEEALAA
jgi:FMN-dependent NADH-azoreductase